MADDRTKRQKLRAMANQTTSPHEAEIAQRKLDALGPDTTPPINSSYTRETVYPGFSGATEADIERWAEEIWNMVKNIQRMPMYRGTYYEESE